MSVKNFCFRHKAESYNFLPLNHPTYTLQGNETECHVPPYNMSFLKSFELFLECENENVVVSAVASTRRQEKEAASLSLDLYVAYYV